MCGPPARVGSTSIATLATGNFLGTSGGNNNQTDLAAVFPGAGTFIWSAAAGWNRIDTGAPSGAPSGLAAVDLNGNGQNEILAQFPGAGVFEFQNGVGWSKYDSTSALPTTSQTPEFATGNFFGGNVLLGAVGFQNTAGATLAPHRYLAENDP